MSARRPAPNGFPPGLIAGLLLLCLAPLPAVRAGEETPPAAPAKAPAAGAPGPQADPLLIGVYPIAPEAVVDGDTVRLPNGQPSVRILALDCEEVDHGTERPVPGWEDFAAYAKAKRGDHPRPVKYGTPAGDAARDALRQLVRGCTRMRLERDRVGARDHGTYGRLLAHVILQTPKGDVHVAEALIRAGHSPYFVKYGRSKRFGARLRAAQAEAREHQRGIWSATGPAHYPDYPERLAWWSARADQVAAWESVANKPDHVTLGAPGAEARLQALVGRPAVVFGLLERELRVKAGDKRIFLLGHERGRGFPLVLFDLEQAKALDEREPFHSMYVTVRGMVTRYKGRPQMVVEKAAQVRTEIP